jgi:hypothetical protein
MSGHCGGRNSIAKDARFSLISVREQAGEVGTLMLLTRGRDRTLSFSIPKCKQLFALLFAILKQLLKSRPVNTPSQFLLNTLESPRQELDFAEWYWHTTHEDVGD